jgi:septum formation protein|tara:strand:- start:36 stop:620 length:585 start_codon:yes stop_codon:yes gene_type:complete
VNNIILASSSVYRKNLLNRLIPKFKIISPEVDESLILGENAKIAASRLALIKAKKVSVLNKTAYVIGSDQTAEFDNIQIKKPNNYDEALKQLLLLSDKRVNFYSAVCVIQETTNIKQEAIEVIEVKYKKITEEQARTYLKYENPLGCLGCIKSEGLGISLLEHVKCNDPTAIIGMPLIKLSNIFNSLNIKLHAS